MPENTEGFTQSRRVPAKDRKVSEISREDVRVRLLGTVIDRKDNVVVLDDGSGKINAVFNEPVNASVSGLVRIMGKVIPAEQGFEIQGEILQDMSKVDLKLYRSISELEGKE